MRPLHPTMQISTLRPSIRQPTPGSNLKFSTDVRLSSTSPRQAVCPSVHPSIQSLPRACIHRRRMPIHPFILLSSPDGSARESNRLSESATLPIRGSVGSAGYDLAAAHATVIPRAGKGIVKTDLAVAIPEGGSSAPCSSWKAAQV